MLLNGDKLSIAPVRAEDAVAAKALAARIDGLMPRVRITDVNLLRSRHIQFRTW